MTVKCFYCEPTQSAWVMLRRYQHSDHAGQNHYHNASTLIGMCDHWKKYDDDEAQTGDWVYADNAPKLESFDRNDDRWPVKCESCDYLFTPEDTYQVFTDAIYRRTDTYQAVSLRRLPEGGMWDAEWLKSYHHAGTDGRILHVVCPGGRQWCIDGRASNCTMPDDNEHFCWVRHGEVPNITVDKAGHTCNAGAGSIIAGKYHGFLRNGEFTDA